VSRSDSVFYHTVSYLGSAGRKQKWIPIPGDAVMFLMIHFPVWIRTGIFVTDFTCGAFLVIMGLSAVFSLTFIKSKSIVIPAFLHFYWDLQCFLL
jgi:hypothetical protein